MGKINNKSYLKARETVPYMLVVKAPVLPLEMRIDYELSTKVWDVKINTKSYLKVSPTLQSSSTCQGIKNHHNYEGSPRNNNCCDFENILGIEVMVGKISHKTLLGRNINMLRKAFVDVKVIGSGTELLGDYEVFRHLNWNIVNLKNIDVEWT